MQDDLLYKVQKFRGNVESDNLQLMSQLNQPLLQRKRSVKEKAKKLKQNLLRDTMPSSMPLQSERSFSSEKFEQPALQR